jgi:hypothetical protein
VLPENGKVDRVHTIAAIAGLSMIYGGLHVLVAPAAGVLAVGVLLLASVIYARTRP